MFPRLIGKKMRHTITAFLCVFIFPLAAKLSLPQSRLDPQVFEKFYPEVLNEIEKELFVRQNDGRTLRDTREYGYSFHKTENSDFSFTPIPSYLQMLGNAVCEALGHPPQEFTNVIVSLYPRGFHLEPHFDRNAIDPRRGCYFDEKVYGLVIEPDATGHLYFVRDDQNYIPPLDLEPILSIDEKAGTVYCLEGESRYLPYFHAISNVSNRRISVTFRNVIIDERSFPFFRNKGFVRDLSTSFENSLKLNPPPIPINLALAKQQHERYIDLLKILVLDLVRLDADPNHPDCNFIEDTAIIVGDTAVISRMGAIERRGEEGPVAEMLEWHGLKNIIHLQSPSTMDGGDILYTGNHLFVGLSSRTNANALKDLEKIFEGKTKVIGIQVAEGLHLKSLISLADTKTLVIADTPGGRDIRQKIDAAAPDYEFLVVPDPVAANVLRIASTLVVQAGFPDSEKIFKAFCDEKGLGLAKLDMSELIKADGALTCGCLLY